MRAKQKSDVSGLTTEQYIEYIRNLPKDACKGRCKTIRNTVMKSTTAAAPVDPDLAKVRAMLAKRFDDEELYSGHLTVDPSSQRRK